MAFWNSQLSGIIIGSGIALASSILVQAFAYWRQKKQFAHDLEARQQQFAHEREQDNRGRRTAALVDLQGLLEDQAAALQDLWTFTCNSAPHHRPNIAIEEAWDVLLRKSYRRIVWPINDPEETTLNAYAGAIRELLEFLRQQEEISALRTGEISTLDEELRATVGQNCKAVTGLLSRALKQVSNLTSELNDVQVGKAT